MASTLGLRHTLLRPSRFTTVRASACRTTASFGTMHKYLVTPAELDAAIKSNAPTANHISTAPKVIPVCGAWFLPNDPQQRRGSDVFAQAHIPAACFFDLDRVADTSSPYPHMLPTPSVFQQAMCELGIRREDTVVVYDSVELGVFSAPRVAWTFRVFGHPAVHVLNNFRLWVQQGLPTESGAQQSFERTEYPLPTLDASRVIGFEGVKELTQDHNKEGREEVSLLDARSAGRFNGTEPEPRPGLSSGHIPGSTSLPVPELLDPDTKAFLSAERLREVFKQKGVDESRPVVASCGTGVSAAVIEAALVEAGLGEGSRRIYDGSWTEWAQRVEERENLIVKSEE